MVPARCASAMPSSVRSTSWWPVKRFSLFHSLSPWRTSTSTFAMGLGVGLPGFMSLTARSRSMFWPVSKRVKGSLNCLGFAPFSGCEAIDLDGLSSFFQGIGQGSKSKHVGHGVQPWTLVAAPKCRSHCAAGENAPIGRDMGKLDTLAGAGEDDFMLADDVAAAERSKSDIAVVPWADIAFTGPHTLVGEGNTPGLGCGIAEQKRGAGRCVPLVAVMHL